MMNYFIITYNTAYKNGVAKKITIYNYRKMLIIDFFRILLCIDLLRHKNLILCKESV